MQAAQYFLLSMTAILFVVAGITFVHNVLTELDYRVGRSRGMEVATPPPLRWRVTVALALLAWIPFLAALGIALFPIHMLPGLH